MPCSCPGDGAGRGRRGPRGRWPEVPLHALLAVLVLVSVPASPAPFQGDPAPGRSPGPPSLTPTAPTRAPTTASGNVTTAPPPTVASPSAMSKPEEAWCTGYAGMGRASDAPRNHAVNLSLSHGLYQPGYGLVVGVKYRVWVQAPLAVVRDFSLWSSAGSWVGSPGPCRGLGVAGGGGAALSVGEAVFQWLAEDTTESRVTFRLRYRLADDSHHIYQREMHLLMRKDCTLWLWPSWGDLSWLDLPHPDVNCLVWFPSRSLHEDDAVVVAGLPLPFSVPPLALVPSGSAADAESNDIRRQQLDRRRRDAKVRVTANRRPDVGPQDDQRVDGDDVLREGFQARAMGLLVDLMRLNVACSSGGWLHLGDPNLTPRTEAGAVPESSTPTNTKLCGKLEELAASQRRLHFQKAPALRVHGSPVFALRYRLVDYCHQVALVHSNASVPLVASPGLTCSFSVTLPHGYHVNLRLLVGEPIPGTVPDTVDINTAPQSSEEEDGSDMPSTGTDTDAVLAVVTELPDTVASGSPTVDASLGSLSFTSTASSTTAYHRSSARHGPTAAVSATRPKRPRSRRDGPTQAPQAPAAERPTPSSARVAELLRDAMLREHRAAASAGGVDPLHAQALALTRNMEASDRSNDTLSSASSSEESSEKDAGRRVRRQNYNDVVVGSDALSPRPPQPGPSPTAPGPPCLGTWLNLTDGVTTWTHCASRDRPARQFRFLSSRNTLRLSVAMGVGAVPLRLDYDARPVRRVVQGCAYGWVAVGQFCVSAVEDFRLSWADAETECRRLGGHLASITDQEAQRAIDDLLTNSPGYSDHNSYWVGASDVTNEGDFRWTDSLPFSYTNWFPGWTQHGGYNRQPNDDGFSAQDCVELRRAFLLPPPPAASAPAAAILPLDSSFRWNDRDCNTRNHFLCERPRDAQYSGGEQWGSGDCTRSVVLTRETPRAIVSSPGFPRAYPDNAQCDVDITAPTGYRIVLDFEEFVLEKEPYCSYDYLTIREDGQEDVPNAADPSLHPGLGPPGPPGHGNASNNSIRSAPGPHDPAVSHLGLEGHVVVGKEHHRYCGDWSEKLKLLRYASRGPRLRLRFVSDYSHHFGGFKARVSAETVAMECPDGRLHSFNNSCFLVVSFPQVTWQTAKQVCQGLKAELAEVYSTAEQDFVVERIRHSADYTTTNTYWLGGMLGLEGRWQWLSGEAMSFTGWIPSPSSLPDPVEPGVEDDNPEDSVDSQLPSSCLGLQWLSSPSAALPSGLYWRPRKCSAVGGYVCRRQQTPLLAAGGGSLNSTVTEPGDLSSPGYPSGYPANLDYQVRLVGPPQTRAVIRFARVDLESQAQCLYDFIELSDGHGGARQGRRKVICGQHHSAMDRFDFVSASNEAMLRFHADYSVAGAGFLGSWTAVDVSGCPQQTLSAREGVLTSPFYPHKLLPNLQCTAVIRAPAGRRVWLEFSDVDLSGAASVWVDLGAGRRVAPTSSPVSGGVLLSTGERLDVVLTTLGLPRGRGFRATYRTVALDPEEVVVQLQANATLLPIRHLNYPAPPPVNVNFLQRFIAPLGTRLQLQLFGVVLVRPGAACAGGAGHLEVRDSYTDPNGSSWTLCEAPDTTAAPIVITSFLNTLQLWQRGGEAGVNLNATIQPLADEDYRVKLVRMNNASWSVESCSPNPCQNDGKCLARDRRRVCECKGHFTGLLCGLTECDLEPCVWGKCILTPVSFRCSCAPHYKGTLCNIRAKPCQDNPCEGRGECHEKGDTFHCRCHAWWEGPKCERRMSVPFKPLSERMLQEPFWLGLITVTAVLGVIGLFWCAKRHFPEKLEKLLAEEADRNRSGGIYPSRGSSLRDQLSASVGGSHSLAASATGGTGSGTGGSRGELGPGSNGGGSSREGSGPQPPRSLLGRLGIRKPSILSLNASHSPSDQPLGLAGTTARTFSLDDLLRPPPGSKPAARASAFGSAYGFGRTTRSPSQSSASGCAAYPGAYLHGNATPGRLRPLHSLGSLGSLGCSLGELRGESSYWKSKIRVSFSACIYPFSVFYFFFLCRLFSLFAAVYTEASSAVYTKHWTFDSYFIKSVKVFIC